MVKGKKGGLSTIFLAIIMGVIIVGGALYFVGINPIGFTKSNISNAYHAQLDVAFPDYLDNKKVACAEHSGTWYDQRDKIGCFNIEIPWDANICISTELDVMQSICGGLSGKWVCDTNKAGCYY